MPTRHREPVENLKQRRAALKAQLAQVGDLRPGSLVERYRRCGKAGCRCASPDAEGHGPSWSLTREVDGKTVTRVIPPEVVEQTKHQLVEYRRFRGLVRAFIDTSEQLCDVELDAAKATSDEAVKKGAPRKTSRRRSTRTSSRRSKPS
jgi:hypothetical protein